MVKLSVAIGLVLVGVFHASLEAQTIPRDTSYTVSNTYKKLRREYPGIKPVEPFSLKGIHTKKDEVYLLLKETPYGTRELHVDIFYPSKKGRYPALLLIHGGGWRSGDKSMNIPMAQQLASRGFVVVSAEYRLSLEAKYPDAIRDLKAAIRWMRANAKQYYINADRIAVGGASAGGQLASLIGVTNGKDFFEGTEGNVSFSSDVQAVVNMDGLLDFTNEVNLRVKRNANSADVFWLQGSFDQIPERWKEASALTWVNEKSPPFLFINSSQTRFHGGCEEMKEKLKSMGIYSQVQKWEDAPHSYWLFDPWFEPTVQCIDQFLTKVFKSKA